MSLVVAPVRYPLTSHSRATLERAVDVALERDADLIVLHVNLYQNDRRVTRTELKAAVEGAFGRLSRARYVVRSGFIVEETILDEVAAERADVVVVGAKQVGRLRRVLGLIVDDPDVERFLREQLDCEIITVNGR